MERTFSKNLFIMLFAIMIGAIIVTYFFADIVRRSEIETYKSEISFITAEKNIFENNSRNFTDHFIKSLGALDLSREYRAEGNSYFDFATNIWFIQDEYQKVIDNCSLAKEKYIAAYENFLNAKSFFNDTMTFTDVAKYQSIIYLYMDLSYAGANISMLRYNASNYMVQIAENLSLYGKITDVSDLFELFNETEEMYDEELEYYNEIKDDIEYEYGKYFNPNRETP